MPQKDMLATIGVMEGFQSPYRRPSSLQITAVSLEDVMRRPDAPEGEQLLHLETKSLRDLRAILADASLADCAQFVEEHAHPRLWKLLAEAALEKRDWATAEKAFVRYQDYYGIQVGGFAF
jgi:WD repeat-containing protein 35